MIDIFYDSILLLSRIMFALFYLLKRFCAHLKKIIVDGYL